MLTEVRFTSEQPGVPLLPLGGFSSNNKQIQIRNIDGLEPVTADVATTGYATGRGEMSTGVSIPKRNIVLTFGLNPTWVDQTITSLRQLLYLYFMPGQVSHMRFISTELPDVYIDGIVESVEPNIFSQDPEIQVSILCLKPDFISVDAVNYSGGITAGSPEAEFDYIGTVSTGFELTITAPVGHAAYTGTFTVRNTTRGIDHDLIFGPVTVNPTKSIKLQTTPTLRYLRNVPVPDVGTFTTLVESTASEWPEILPGHNAISILPNPDVTGLLFVLSYVNRFGGL